jgi:hypothetical protein
MHPAMRVATALMGIVFLLAAAVQYNDPDPLLWVLVYGAAAVACGLAVFGRPQRLLSAMTGGAALVWALMLMPRVFGQVRPSELFRETGMATLGIEEAREAIGLILVAGWMLVLFSRRRGGRGGVGNWDGRNGGHLV